MERIAPEHLLRLLGAWQTGDMPPARALTVALTELIDGAHLPAGQRMPAERELAAGLGVARGTIARAYAALAASGHLARRPGSGTYVRHPRSGAGLGEGRLTSFDGGTPGLVADLSSGALPGPEMIARAMPEVGRLLHEHHLGSSGYHPAGLPELRAAIARMLDGQGLPTTPDDVLITAGSQQGLWLLATALTEPGDLVAVEDPTYRGALEAFANAGARLRGVPMSPTGIDTGLLTRAAAEARLVYLQPALHNPTGIHTAVAHRRRIAEAVSGGDGTSGSPALVVDDQSGADLSWTRSGRLGGLERLVTPERLLIVGTESKLFWGGIRVGWIRAPRPIITRLTDLRRSLDLSGSVLDQLTAVLLLPQAEVQQRVRRAELATRYDRMAEVLGTITPGWTWWLPAGGSGLWVDTGTDAVALAQQALARGVRLTAGPAFSPHEAHRQFLRLPVWQDADHFAEALTVVAGLPEAG